MKKITALFFILIMSFIVSSSIFSQQYDDLQEKPVDNDRLKLFPVEGKNYFFLQSIDNVTRIVIGDFTQIDKKVILINLKDDYTTIKSVIEYIPAKNEMRVLTKSDSKFFTTDMTKLKKDIITGSIFKGNYAELMKSYGELEGLFKQNDLSKIFPETYGFSVKLNDIDGKEISAMYTFGNTAKGYYMQFKTFNYRENPRTKKIPALKYSVYSKNTNDPVIQEYVEALFKIKKPASSFVK